MKAVYKIVALLAFAGVLYACSCGCAADPNAEEADQARMERILCDMD